MSDAKLITNNTIFCIFWNIYTYIHRNPDMNTLFSQNTFIYNYVYFIWEYSSFILSIVLTLMRFGWNQFSIAIYVPQRIRPSLPPVFWTTPTFAIVSNRATIEIKESVNLLNYCSKIRRLSILEYLDTFD